MDCLHEWDYGVRKQKSQVLLDWGRRLVESPPSERGCLMVSFIEYLIRAELAFTEVEAIVLLAETYASAMVIDEIGKVLNIVEGKTTKKGGQ